MKFFQQRLTKALVRVLNKKVRLNNHVTVEAIRAYTTIFFRKTATYRALTTGVLKAHFGFHRGSELGRVDPIIEIVANNIFSRFTGFNSSGKNLRGSWTLYLNSNTYSQILSLPSSVVSNEGLSGEDFYWLKALLLEGNEYIISDFHIKFDDFENKAYSRSGEAIMVPTGQWKVPGHYSGTAENNWITRTFNSVVYQRRIKSLVSKFLL